VDTVSRWRGGDFKVLLGMLKRKGNRRFASVVFLATPAYDNIIAMIYLAFTLPSAFAVSLLPPQPPSTIFSRHFALAFDPDYGNAVPE
jgi:hypothetical protein